MKSRTSHTGPTSLRLRAIINDSAPKFGIRKRGNSRALLRSGCSHPALFLLLFLTIGLILSGRAFPAVAAAQVGSGFDSGSFSWKASAPLIDVGPGKDAADPHVSIKDPTVVFSGGRWHLFATVRMKSGKVDIEYLNFADWPQAGPAPRHVLAMHDQYYCAPQEFYFTPHRKWYLIYKAYLADRLEGPWKGLVDTLAKPFAAASNVRQDTEWTTNISHGELIRSVADELMEVDPENPRFVFQGASDAESRGQGYGGIPWRLGILEMQSQLPRGQSERN